jgi:hypothetical protein
VVLFHRSRWFSLAPLQGLSATSSRVPPDLEVWWGCLQYCKE